MFTDEDGNVDYEALQASELASEYNQIVNVIIPNIEAAIWIIAQADYDMITAKRNKTFAQRLAKVKKIAAVL